jgi:hypothetical protein
VVRLSVNFWFWGQEGRQRNGLAIQLWPLNMALEAPSAGPYFAGVVRSLARPCLPLPHPV